jgi:hypothetical protein
MLFKSRPTSLHRGATMLSHFLPPPLPPPQSWYPGHMTQFFRILPDLLARTDVVLELRDARLPLSSVNRNFEGEAVLSRSQRIPQGRRQRCVCGSGGSHVFAHFTILTLWGLSYGSHAEDRRARHVAHQNDALNLPARRFDYPSS